MLCERRGIQKKIDRIILKITDTREGSHKGNNINRAAICDARMYM